MRLHTNQMSDSFRIGAMLAVVGGFLDAYSYLVRGQVFANAQTGNIVLMGINLAEGHISKAFSYFIPIFAFFVGVIVDEIIRKKLDGKLALHWRQVVLLIEMGILLIVMLLPQGRGNFLANALVSFICSLQVQSFRKVHGLPYATTMCTGNLRSGTEHLVRYMETKEKSRKTKCLSYYGIIAFFVLGAGIGAIFIHYWSSPSLMFCFVLLGISFLMLFVKEQEIDSHL